MRALYSPPARGAVARPRRRVFFIPDVGVSIPGRSRVSPIRSGPPLTSSPPLSPPSFHREDTKFGPYDETHLKSVLQIQRHYRGFMARDSINTALRLKGANVLKRRNGLAALHFRYAFQRQLYLWVEEGDNVVNAVVGYLVVALIIVATLGFVLETVPEWTRHADAMTPNPFKALETVCIICFTVEIIAKLLSQPLLNDSYPAALRQWILQPMNQVDVVAVLPWYVELVFGGGSGLGVVRCVRLVRVFRVFKLGRYNTSAMIFKNALARSAQPMSLLFYFMLIANVLFASAMYYAESLSPRYNPTDADNFDDPLPAFPFDSIPRAMYWCMVTMTTVGYGDMYPVTLIGRLVGVLTMMAGIVVIALPVTLIGSNFVEEYRKSQAREAAEKKRKAAEARAIEDIRAKATLRVMASKKNADGGGGGGGAGGEPGTPLALARRDSATMTPGDRALRNMRARMDREAASGEAFAGSGGLPWDPSPAGVRGGGTGFDSIEVSDRLDAVERRMARIENLLAKLVAASAAKA